VVENRALTLVFCGTPRFAVPTLERLVSAGFSVALVVTQPDRAKGRGLEVAPSPVKESAVRLGLPVVQPDKIKNNTEFQAELAALKPDAIIVVGYGRLIPDWMIALPPLGNINLHASLLPKYRGAGPIQWAIACGETVTGVTTMRIDAGLDTGEILLQQEVAIAADDTAVTLAPRLAAIGADLMVESLRGLKAGTVQARRQDHALATLAPILKKEDGLIDFQRPAQELHNRMRGFQPWPGAFTTFRGKQLQVLAASALAKAVADPGQIAIEGGELLVGCGNTTALHLVEVQPEGKKKMTGRDFLNGYGPQAGEKLGG
jgi:methionyl-tRNA formyltransferase